MVNVDRFSHTFRRLAEVAQVLKNPELYLTREIVEGRGPGEGDVQFSLLARGRHEERRAFLFAGVASPLRNPDGSWSFSSYVPLDLCFTLVDVFNIYEGPPALLGFISGEQISRFGFRPAQLDQKLRERAVFIHNYNYNRRTGEVTYPVAVAQHLSDQALEKRK